MLLVALGLLTSSVSADAPSTPSVMRTVAEAGRTRIIAIPVERAVQERELTVTTSDPAVVSLAQPTRVAAGADLAYVRIRGHRPGRARLTLGDGRTWVIEVEPVRATRPHEEPMPRLTGVAPGAALWGDVAVGLEVFVTAEDAIEGVALELSNGTRLAPERHTPAERGPWRRAWFRMSCKAIDPGPLTLTPLVQLSGDREIRGDCVTARIIRPEREDVTAGEAEEDYEVERPERFRDDRRSIARDRRASGERCWVNNGAYPAVCFPMHVEEPGWHQMMVVASGTMAGGALPTVAAVVNGSNQPVTNGRLVASDWHRIAVGAPFMLDAGDHVITPFFANDFYAPGLADRNLRLDRIEVARVGDASGEAARASREPAMMNAMMSGMMAGMMGGGGSAETSADPWGETDQPLRLCFRRAWHGKRASGEMLIEGNCEAPAGGVMRAPVVTLVINEEPVMSQRTRAPRFVVDPAYLTRPRNSVFMRAEMDNGTTTESTVHTVLSPIEPVAPDREPRRYARYTFHDSWALTNQGAADRHYPRERAAIGFHSNGAATLSLPEDLAGEFDVGIEAWGEGFRGAPEMVVTFTDSEGAHAMDPRQVPSWWGPHYVGRVSLAGGEQTVSVEFTNDLYEEGAGDRNMLVQSISLYERSSERDRTPPAITWHYPDAGHEAWREDAVVFEASDDVAIARVELLINDMATGLAVSPERGEALMSLPLILRDLPAGEHTVAVRVWDSSNNRMDSEPRRIRVLDEAPEEPGPYHRAVRITTRFGYGPSERDLATILMDGERAWLRDQLLRPYDDPGDAAAIETAAAHFTQRRSDYHASARAVTQGMLTVNPVRARFVLWAQDHFSTWARKTEGDRKWDEHMAFTRLGAARFADLLMTSAMSPAMLRYLDQDTSFAGRINENYAREIMELHTLGVDGGYSQEDVTELAHLLAGWTASTEGDGRSAGEARAFTFRFDPALNDGRPRHLLGMPFPSVPPEARFDRIVSALELLAAHPSTARFVSRSLIEHYVCTPAPEELVEELSAIYEETGGDVAEMVLAIPRHEAFWTHDEPRLAQPFEFAMRLTRACSYRNPWAVRDFLNRSGAGVFDRSTPDGYPEEDSAYTDSNALVQRWRLAQSCAWDLSRLVPNDWKRAGGASEEALHQRIVDALAIRLNGCLLGNTSNEAVLTYLAETEGSLGERVTAVAPLIAQMPESNTR